VSETRPVRRWPIVVVRVLAFVLLLQVLTQAALAGGFVTGDVGLLGLHSANGILLVLTSAALLPAAILLVRPGGGPWWPIVLSVALWWAIAIQVGFGFARQVGLHIPLGMTIMGMVSAFAWWSCAYRPRPVAPVGAVGAVGAEATEAPSTAVVGTGRS
jgi:hypothetical protein